MSVFANIIGHEPILRVLTHTLSKPAHAYLFCGPRGVGKMTVAEKFTQGLLQETSLSSHPDFIRLAREEGAREIVVKQARELLARIKSILRRTRALPPNMRGNLRQQSARFWCFENWTLDTIARQLNSPQNVLVPLSGSEYRLLRIFLENPNCVLNRDQLIELIHGREAEAYDRVIDVQISRLRQRLDNCAFIKTVRGQGYIFASAVTTKND